MKTNFCIDIWIFIYNITLNTTPVDSREEKFFSFSLFCVYGCVNCCVLQAYIRKQVVAAYERLQWDEKADNVLFDT